MSMIRRAELKTRRLLVFTWDGVVCVKCEGWFQMSLIPEADLESQDVTP